MNEVKRIENLRCALKKLEEALMGSDYYEEYTIARDALVEDDKVKKP